MPQIIGQPDDTNFDDMRVSATGDVVPAPIVIRITHLKRWSIHAGHRPDEWVVECAKFPGRFDEKSWHGATMRITYMRLALSKIGIEDVEVEWTHGPGAHPACKCHEGGAVVTGGDPAMRARADESERELRPKMEAMGLL